MSKVHPLNQEPEPDTDSEKAKKPGGGNGNTTDYRLQELERRATEQERTTKQINDTVIKIETGLGSLKESIKDLPSKAYVVTTLVVTLLVAIFTVLAHILLKGL